MQISQKKERKRTQHSFYKVKKEHSVLFSKYIYLYIYIYILYIYIYTYIIYIYTYILKKERNVLTFFWKRTKYSHVLLRSLQKNGAFFAFFSVLCKRTLHSFLFFRKERKRTECSFGSHKSPKTRKKNRKQRNIPFKERKRMEHTKLKRMRCPTLLHT